MTEAIVSTKTRVLVGHRSDLPEGTQRIISLPGYEVGVIVHEGEFYAYKNRCAHQGGPVCEGMVIGKVMADIAPDQTAHGEYFSTDDPHLVCPWHGMEYHLKTGVSAVNPRRRLSVHEIVVDVDDNVYILI